MGFFDGFPFTNTHQLNLDWVLTKLKSLESISDDAKAAIERANSAVSLAENAASNSQHYSEQAAGVVQTLYGVGSIYISTNHISPAIFFGGTWERILERFLFAAHEAGGYAGGSTGGEATHKLSVNEMPSHGHNLENTYLFYSNQTAAVTPPSAAASGIANLTGVRQFIENGGNQPHNNMPPYLAVYMWKRID